MKFIQVATANYSLCSIAEICIDHTSLTSTSSMGGPFEKITESKQLFDLLFTFLFKLIVYSNDLNVEIQLPPFFMVYDRLCVC